MSAIHSPNPWLLTYVQRPQAALNLFCFPYAGGGAQIFRTWQNAFPEPAGVQVWGVQYPGRAGRVREAPLTDYVALLDGLTPALLPLLHKPFAFFGHSMGAILAFESARALRRRHGLAPRHLFVSGRRAPQVKKEQRTTYDLPDAAFVEELRRLKGTPAQVLEHEELLRLMLPLLRADFQLVQTYTYEPGPPLECPISAYGGLGDEEVERADLAPWCEQTSAPCSLKMFEGDHFFLQAAEPLLLQDIRRELLARW